MLGSDFERVFSFCVRKVLTSILGDRASSRFLQYVECRYSLRREEVRRHPHGVLQGTAGDVSFTSQGYGGLDHQGSAETL